MPTYTPTRRPLMLKLSAWIECTYLAWLIKHAEHDVEDVRRDRVAAFAHADQLTYRIAAYEAHVNLLAQRLARAMWK